MNKRKEKKKATITKRTLLAIKTIVATIRQKKVAENKPDGRNEAFYGVGNRARLRCQM